MLIHARDQTPISYHHRHLHMQVENFMAVVIGQLGRRQTIVHRFLNADRVFYPALPVLFGEPVASVLDYSDSQAVFKGLSCNVVARFVLVGQAVALEVI